MPSERSKKGMDFKMKKIKELYLKYKEIINYLFFGGCTTIVNFISYYIPVRIIGIDEVISNSIAWCISVLFAYVTNKIFVFSSKKENLVGILKEMFSFIFARLFTGALCDIGLFALMINILGIINMTVELVVSIIIFIFGIGALLINMFSKKSSKSETSTIEK